MKTTTKTHTATRFQANPNQMLRERETEALLWLVEGKSAAEAALIMGTSERTQKAHRQRAMEALGANNAPSLVGMAFYHRILTCLCLVLTIFQFMATSVTQESVRRAPRTAYTRQIARSRTRQENLGEIRPA